MSTPNLPFVFQIFAKGNEIPVFKRLKDEYDDLVRCWHQITWPIVRSMILDTAVVLIVAILGLIIIMSVSAIPLNGDSDEVVGLIEEWFPRISIGGLLLYFLISMIRGLADWTRRDGRDACC